MSKPVNSGKAWTKADDVKIKQMARSGVDTDDIARKLGRSKNAVYKEASKEGISLKPKDK